MVLAVSDNPASADSQAVVREDGCEACFFGARDLCSLPQAQVCSTFRPSHTSQLVIDPRIARDRFRRRRNC